MILEAPYDGQLVGRRQRLGEVASVSLDEHDGRACRLITLVFVICSLGSNHHLFW